MRELLHEDYIFIVIKMVRSLLLPSRKCVHLFIFIFSSSICTGCVPALSSTSWSRIRLCRCVCSSNLRRAIFSDWLCHSCVLNNAFTSACECVCAHRMNVLNLNEYSLLAHATSVQRAKSYRQRFFVERMRKMTILNTLKTLFIFASLFIRSVVVTFSPLLLV